MWLRHTYLDDLDNIKDMLSQYDEYIGLYRKRHMKDKVRIEVGGKTFEFDPIRDFTSRKLRKPLAGKYFVKALGDLVHSDTEIGSSV